MATADVIVGSVIQVSPRVSSSRHREERYRVFPHPVGSETNIHLAGPWRNAWTVCVTSGLFGSVSGSAVANALLDCGVGTLLIADTNTAGAQKLVAALEARFGAGRAAVAGFVHPFKWDTLAEPARYIVRMDACLGACKHSCTHECIDN